MNKKFVLIAFFGIFISCTPLLAQTTPNLRYAHDDAGNLIGAVDANGNATAYNYDVAGNLVSIERLSARGAADIFFITPERSDVGVRVGTAVTIHGIGFSDMPSQNQVTFNGVAAVVDASTNLTIMTRVPAGARTGLVQVISPMGTAVSRRNFKINNCIPPLSGLVSWWTGDGHARDIISRNHATRQGAVTFVPGVVSHAFSLDGSSSFVSVSNRPNLNPGGANFTVGFWMKTASTGRWRALLNKREDCGGVRSFWDIRLSADGHIEVELTANGVLYGIIDTTTVNDGSWHHIALARQGTTVTLYIDGQTRGAVDTKSVLSIVNTAPILFGSHPCIGTDPTQFYQGLIDEVEWFNRALSSAEVQSLFNAGESGMCKP